MGLLTRTARLPETLHLAGIQPCGHAHPGTCGCQLCDLSGPTHWQEKDCLSYSSSSSSTGPASSSRLEHSSSFSSNSPPPTTTYSPTNILSLQHCLYTPAHTTTPSLSILSPAIPSSSSLAGPLYRRLNLGPQLALRSSEPFPAASSKIWSGCTSWLAA